MNTNPINPEEALDEATRVRLSQLRSMPIDMSKLKDAIRTQIPQREVLESRRQRWWLGPRGAIAASIGLVGLLIVLVIASSAGPVYASADQLASLHQATVRSAMPMGSMSTACDWLASQLPDTPEMPNILLDKVPACCVGHIGRKPLGCMVMDVDNTSVTLAIARAGEFKTNPDGSIERDGVHYGIQSSGGVQIVTFARDGRWHALIGVLPAERLVEFARTLKV